MQTSLGHQVSSFSDKGSVRQGWPCCSSGWTKGEGSRDNIHIRPHRTPLGEHHPGRPAGWAQATPACNGLRKTWTVVTDFTMTEFPELGCAGRSPIYWHIAGSQELHCSLGHDVTFSTGPFNQFKPYTNSSERVHQSCSGWWVTLVLNACADL